MPEVGQQGNRVAGHRARCDAGQRDAGVEPCRHRVHHHQQRDRGLGRGVDAGVHERQVQRQQAAGHIGRNQLATEQHAQNDGANGQALDPAVGLDQLRGRQQLGEDAVFGRRVGRRAQPHQGVGQQRMHTPQHQQAADHLDRVADEHHLTLGPRVSKSAHEGREDHVKQRKQRHQRCRLPARRLLRAQQLDGHHKERVVRQRAEELRRHDGVEAALHGGVGCAEAAQTRRWARDFCAKVRPVSPALRGYSTRSLPLLSATLAAAIGPTSPPLSPCPAPSLPPSTPKPCATT